MTVSLPDPQVRDFAGIQRNFDALAKAATSIVFYESGQLSERTTTLPVALETVTPADMRVIYSVKVSDLRAGDLLVAMSEAEFTNDLGHNCMLASRLRLTSSVTDVDGGYEMGEDNAFNITPDMHHGTSVKHAMYRVRPQDILANFEYVNLICWSADSAFYHTPGTSLTVEQDYGRLSVLKISGVA